MRTHRIVLDIFERDASQTENRVFPTTELQRQTLQPAEFTRQIKMSDNLVTIPLPNPEPKYLVIIARYTQDDPAAEVVKGDPAPFSVRLNGDTVDRELEGMLAWFGPVTSLEVATSYDTNKIELEFLMG